MLTRIQFNYFVSLQFNCVFLVEGDLPRSLRDFSRLDLIVRVSCIGQDHRELFSRNVQSNKENKILTATK